MIVYDVARLIRERVPDAAQGEGTIIRLIIISLLGGH